MGDGGSGLFQERETEKAATSKEGLGGQITHSLLRGGGNITKYRTLLEVVDLEIRPC